MQTSMSCLQHVWKLHLMVWGVLRPLCHYLGDAWSCKLESSFTCYHKPMSVVGKSCRSAAPSALFRAVCTTRSRSRHHHYREEHENESIQYEDQEDASLNGPLACWKDQCFIDMHSLAALDRVNDKRGDLCHDLVE